MINVDHTINWREFVCGWGAAFLSVSITYPINKLIFRQMLDGVKISNAVYQLKYEGIGYLYRGIFPPLCQKTISMSLMFGVYDTIRRLLRPNGQDTTISKTEAAIVAGTTELIMVPFERIQTLLQDRKYHKTFRNMFHAFGVVKNYGVFEYYRGITPIACRNIPCNIIYFNFRDVMNWNSTDDKSETFKLFIDFVNGAFVGAFLSTAAYPLNLTKVQMQSKLGGPWESPWTVLASTYRKRGSSISKLYIGAFGNSMRSMISWGLMNCGYTILKKILY